MKKIFQLISLIFCLITLSSDAFTQVLKEKIVLRFDLKTMEGIDNNNINKYDVPAPQLVHLEHLPNGFVAVTLKLKNTGTGIFTNKDKTQEATIKLEYHQDVENRDKFGIKDFLIRKAHPTCEYDLDLYLLKDTVDYSKLDSTIVLSQKEVNDPSTMNRGENTLNKGEYLDIHLLNGSKIPDVKECTEANSSVRDGPNNICRLYISG